MQKFYDATTNGLWDNDPSEPALCGWEVTVYDNEGNPIDTLYTGVEPVCSKWLDPGTYTVTETIPPGWVNTTLESLSVEIDSGMVEGNDKEYDVEFGNVCLGPGGSKTLGYWSNRNGQARFDSGDLASLVALNLRNADGTDFDPSSYRVFRSWLLGAQATNMAYMLSAQLAAMVLNMREPDFANAGSMVYAPCLLDYAPITGLTPLDS